MTLLSLTGIHKAFDRNEVLRGVTLVVAKGRVIQPGRLYASGGRRPSA